MQWLMVMLGGGLGAALRYGVGRLFAAPPGAATQAVFPWSTLVVNLAGCLAIGLASGLAERHRLLGHVGWVFLVPGFLGGLTTFSAFALDSANALRLNQVPLALLDIGANTVGGILLVLAGIALARALP